MKQTKFWHMKLLTFAFGTLALAFAFSSSKAHAGRGFLLINTGEEIFNIGALPPDLKTMMEEKPGEQIELGYKCSRFGLFFADVWTWNCSVVPYYVKKASSTDGDFIILPEAMTKELTEKYPKSLAKRGFWNRFGIFILLGAVIVLIIVGSKKGKGSEEPSQSTDMNNGNSGTGGNTGDSSQMNSSSMMSSNSSSGNMGGTGNSGS